MKKRVLFSACVLAACLGACTNDDFSTEKAQGIVESNGAETVIGADLVSEGLKIRMNEGTATRVADDGSWEINKDQVGMGWYNYGASTEAILSTQDKATWWSDAATGADTKLYANHIFSVVSNDGIGLWETTTNVYQGAYFMYFPYENLDEITQKKLHLNNVPQKEGFQQDWLNNGLMLSAQDFILKGEDVDPETHTLTKSFIMAPMVNALKLEMGSTEIQGAPEGDGAYLKGMNITSVQLNAGKGNDIFAKADQDLVISGIPTVQTENDQMPTDINPIDEDKTLEKLYEAAANATDGKSFLGKSPVLESTLTTEVQNAAYTLAENRTVRAFALPIPDNGADYSGTVKNPTATVNVGRLNEDGTTKYVLGTFDVNVGNNSAFIGKLKTAFEGTGATLNKVLVHTDGAWGTLDFTTEMETVAQLNLDYFTPATTDIKTIAQWNDLVSVYDALNALQGEENVVDPTFVWNPDNGEEFNGEIKTPKAGNITLQTVMGKKMTITGNTVWPENLLTEKNVNAAIEVAADATLSVGELDETVEVGDKEVIIEANIDNNGIIYAGKNASIGTQASEGGLEGLDNALNADGKNRVIVTYGAYVYPKDGAKGVIAYEVQPGEEELVSKEEVSKIEVLVGSDKNEEWAHINTLIVPEGVKLDLNADGTSGSESDRYEGTESYSYTMPNLSEVDIELTGGSVVKELDGSLVNVQNVYAISGESDIKDIEPLENVVVKGGTLNINTRPLPYAKTLRMKYGKSLEVKGENCFLNVNANVYVTYLTNKSKGTININDANAIYLPNVDNFTNETGSKLTGRLVYTNNTAAQTVKASFEALKANSSATTTNEAAFLVAMNSYVKNQVSAGSYTGNETGDSYLGFYNDFNKWLVSVDETALVAGTDEITSEHLQYFADLTGYVFAWGE